ncbi:MAG: ATP-binding protein [Oscillospiraceae bacterium]|nr:ATP-binding protein [Oscillospiraceae bacterium]
MKKALFRKLLTAMAATLGLCLLVYPLLLPTENYFRLVLQLLPLSLVIGAVMLIPLHFISENFSRNTAQELKKLRIDSKAALTQYPELRPLARQVSSLKAQIDTQMNELTGQQEQLRVLTDNMQEGLLLISATGRVLSHNHAALQLLGQEISPHNDILSVYALSEAEQFQLVVGQALDGARASAIITVGDTAVQLIANPVARENRLTGAVMVLLDVTEREKRDALRREFTANISHELKTPLTSIYGIADMMESGMVKKKDISGFARRIRDESSRMIALIEDIIRLSRLDDESFTEEVLPLDLYEIAENVREQLLPAAEAKQLTVTLEGTPAPMRGVPVIVEEMLYNLCDNAIKYNVENGAVHIKVTRTDQQAVFSVTDTGIGIPQADRERIFERFYRVDKSHSKQIGGTGLGLSIVKHGALFHNATIELESQLGSGTTITLFFPRSAEAAAAAESSARLNPLNVDIPGASEPQLIHVRESAPEPEEITETAAEPEAEPTAEPEETAEAESEEPDEAAQEQSEETEELPENKPEPLTLFDEAELQPEPEPEQASEPYPDPEDETDRLIREAVAALELEVFDDDNDQEPESGAEEVFYYEDDDGEPVEEPEADLIIPEPEEPVAEPRRIDVVPIDEDTMDIRI